MDTETVLKYILVFYITYILTYTILLLIIYFEIPKKIINFFIYKIYSCFFPNRFNELNFNFTGFWHRRTNKFFFNIIIKRNMESLIKMQCDLTNFRRDASKENLAKKSVPQK